MEPERIPLQRAVAVVTNDEIVVRPARAQWIAAATELGIAMLAIAAIVLLFRVAPLFLLFALLVCALILGPTGVLGLIYGAMGTSFIMSRPQQSARWQQGFLGMGIGTNEFVPFARIAHFEVVGDEQATLPSGDRQDVVQWEVRLVKDNARELTVGTVVAARVVADSGVTRANRLAAALAEMAGVEAQLCVLPTAPDAAPGPARRRYRRIKGAPTEVER